MNLRSFALVAGLFAASSSFAGVLTNSVSTTGNQDWSGSLGLEFNVGNSALLVTSFGAFDSGLNGFTTGTTITVGIYDRVSKLLVGPVTTFTGNEGTLVDAWREKATAPIRLSAGGQYVLVASGFNGNDLNYNRGFVGDQTNAATNSATSLLTFVGSSSYSGGTAYPETTDSGPSIRYGAGNMSVTAVPGPPAGLAMMGVGALLRRRRRVRA